MAINNWNILGREINSTVTLLSGLTVYRETESQFQYHIRALWGVFKAQREHRGKTDFQI